MHIHKVVNVGFAKHLKLKYKIEMVVECCYLRRMTQGEVKHRSDIHVYIQKGH